MKKPFGKLAKALCVGALTLCMAFTGLFAACTSAPGIASVAVDENGHLIATMTDGSTQDLGKVAPENGTDGTNGTNGAKGATGDKGAKGDKGDKGDPGAAGVGVKNVWLDEDGHLWIEYTDGRKVDLGEVGELEQGGGTTPEYTEGPWNISATSGSSVMAELDGNTLKITGSGSMKNWASASAVPWYSKSSQITKVEIAEGVKSVGNYAFYSLNVESVFLPESATTVGTKVVKDGVSLYVYSEAMPATNDVYWQNGNSWNIVDRCVDEDTLYWHYDETHNPVAWEKIKVLFIGNSFTFRNDVDDNTGGIALVFDNIAENLGYYVETYMVAGSNWYLENHAKATDNCGKQVDALLRHYSDFDHIVLQEQSTGPIKEYSRYLNGVKAMQTKINETQDHAQIHLYETWGSPGGLSGAGMTSIEEMELALRNATERVSAECGIPVTYVGKAFTYGYQNVSNAGTKGNEYCLWRTSDSRHQSYAGAYLSASVHVATMLGGDPRQATFTVEAKYKDPLSAAVYETYRNVAYHIVFEESGTEPGGPNTPGGDVTEKAILEIAVWGRFIDEAQFQRVFNAFKAKCEAEGISTEFIHYTYYDKSQYNAIKDFTAKIMENGGADIVFACADNLTTQSGTSITEAVVITELGVTITPTGGNASPNRCVALLKETEIARAFYEFSLSAEGKAALQGN